ncbi:MAG: M48 family metalloprotease [Candidatus Omnitrophica bacterium]|nr:M48 family metalloprotease [Candidatus Omnitrophota bacterium]
MRIKETVISLYLRMTILLGLLFAIVYAFVSIFMSAMGISSFAFYVIFAVFIVIIQYMVGPKIVEWTMRVRYLNKGELPEVQKMVGELAKKAKIPVPRIGISGMNLPNAFAFGRSLADGRVCVTKGILNLLNRDELRAVLGHELSHLKNRDVLFITFLSVIPLILYRIFFHLVFFGRYSRRRDSGGYMLLIGLLAFIFYFITNLLVLYASRIREYFADRGSIELGNSPHALATALYKLVYGAARVPAENLKEIEGVKAFFLNDLSKAKKEIRELSALDLDHDGTIDPFELKKIKSQEIKLKTTDKLMELLSTHPNMLKRIKHLAGIKLG